MRVVRSLLALALALAVTLPMGLRAEEPAHYTFSPAPPGTVTQSVMLYMAGQAMHSQWRAIASKKLVGTSTGTKFYQWYISIYQIDNTTYTLRYQSPINGGPLDKVTKASGGRMWFPMQEATIVGAGEFAVQSVDQLVVSSHQTGADCGAATITVFGYNPRNNKVTRNVTVDNGCSLTAKIVRGADGANDSLRLTGPYYDKTAAMCCPTKPSASAALKYVNGKWLQSPAYYTLTQGKPI
ncbi:MAG: hypothetical protein M3R30_05815 [Candidatus Eremiobacteraeota bacterium]|nr:hypothetical protein [Candidatus Eremiobacteraeota bacterium]